MHAQKKNITWTCAGILLALTAGAPVIADDTELLLVTPRKAKDNKPNILFILDTSGSMSSGELTFETYDSTLIYRSPKDTKKAAIPSPVSPPSAAIVTDSARTKPKT